MLDLPSLIYLVATIVGIGLFVVSILNRRKPDHRE